MVEILELVGLLSLPFFLLLDLVWSHRKFEKPRLWRLRALIVSAVSVGTGIAVSILWGTLLAGYSVFDGSVLGIAGGAIVGILTYELIHYWYHRAVHRVDFLWRWAHQIHHSAERLDAFGSAYAHPVDNFFFATWAALVFFPLLGLHPVAGAIAGTFVAFNAAFQHANIKTPRWLGYFIQRPESHGVHHQRGVHRYNYSDLPLWDIVFGTFHNPRTWEADTGFYNGASARLGEMLIGRDVSTPPSASPQARVAPKAPVDAELRRAA